MTVTLSTGLPVEASVTRPVRAPVLADCAQMALAAKRMAAATAACETRIPLRIIILLLALPLNLNPAGFCYGAPASAPEVTVNVLVLSPPSCTPYCSATVPLIVTDTGPGGFAVTGQGAIRLGAITTVTDDVIVASSDGVIM